VTKIIDKAVETNATAIGLSALLVSTSKQMPLCVQELHRAGHAFPVIIGGAAINRAYAERTLFVDEATPYEPGVFYAKDAFEGLSLMDRLVDPATRPTSSRRRGDRPRGRSGDRRGRPSRCPPRRCGRALGDSRGEPPDAAVLGRPRDGRCPPADVWPCLDLKTLFRLHWGGKGRQGRGLGGAPGG
jgi:5-methyltetrahydrofolate--homocysteine methyltransferase